MNFKLGDILSNASRTRFSAELDGAPAVVELDSSAILKLLDRTGSSLVPEAVHKGRDRIETAARRLAEDGFATRDGDGPLIAVSAIDLD